MSWWKNLVSGRSDSPLNTDYYREGADLLREEKFHEALTSFRLALRENPNDTDVLQQIAVTYTHIGMTDEAIRTYRRVLEIRPHAAGAHVGLAFLLLLRGSAVVGVESPFATGAAGAAAAADPIAATVASAPAATTPALPICIVTPL